MESNNDYTRDYLQEAIEICQGKTKMLPEKEHLMVLYALAAERLKLMEEYGNAEN